MVLVKRCTRAWRRTRRNLYVDCVLGAPATSGAGFSSAAPVSGVETWPARESGWSARARRWSSMLRASCLWRRQSVGGRRWPMQRTRRAPAAAYRWRSATRGSLLGPGAGRDGIRGTATLLTTRPSAGEAPDAGCARRRLPSARAASRRTGSTIGLVRAAGQHRRRGVGAAIVSCGARQPAGRVRRTVGTQAGRWSGQTDRTHRRAGRCRAVGSSASTARPPRCRTTQR